jgi:amino-acid N-acetyltransferase
MHAPRIQPGTADDLAEVGELLLRSGLAADDLDRIQGDLVVARTGSAVVGCAAVERHGAYGLLRSVAVDERFRRTGLGRRLVEAAIERASRRGLQALYLLTESAQHFFAKLAFEAVERSELPEPIQRSDQVTRQCPSHAQAMRLRLVPVR